MLLSRVISNGVRPRNDFFFELAVSPFYMMFGSLFVKYMDYIVTSGSNSKKNK